MNHTNTVPKHVLIYSLPAQWNTPILFLNLSSYAAYFPLFWRLAFIAASCIVLPNMTSTL